MLEWFPIHPASDPISTPITCRTTQPFRHSSGSWGKSKSQHKLLLGDVTKKGAKGEVKLEVGTQMVPLTFIKENCNLQSEEYNFLFCVSNSICLKMYNSILSQQTYTPQV